MTTHSTTEAMELLAQTRQRFIEQARAIARAQIQLHGSTHTRAVIDEMERLGLLRHGIKDFWLGSVFRHKDFRWTGTYHRYSDTQPREGLRRRNIHERTIKLWTSAR